MNTLPRNEAPSSAIVSVSLPGWLHHAVQQAVAADGGEISLTIHRALVPYLRGRGFLAQAEAERFELFWRLVNHVVLKAKEIAHDGKFPETITLDAIHMAMKDEWWVTGYQTYIGADIYRTGIAEKGPINREIGFRVKEALGAQVKKDPNGKVVTAKVLGEIIQSYTPLVAAA
jgi:hypothetical protein